MGRARKGHGEMKLYYDHGGIPDIKAIVGVCREDNPADVDDTYGAGTYDTLFPTCPHCEHKYEREELHMCPETQESSEIAEDEKQ